MKNSQPAPSELLDLLAKMKGKKIVVIGDLILDVYIRGFVERISPEAPIPVVEINEPDASQPGGAANVAVNVAALGGHSCCVGVVGRDSAGLELHRALSRRGVCTDGILRVHGRPTTEK